MEDETTRQLPAFEARMMATLGELRAELREQFSMTNARLTALEEKVDSRLRETRPIWEGMKAQLDRIESKLGVFATDTSALLLETRTDLLQVTKRVSQLEARER